MKTAVMILVILVLIPSAAYADQIGFHFNLGVVFSNFGGINLNPVGFNVNPGSTLEGYLVYDPTHTVPTQMSVQLGNFVASGNALPVIQQQQFPVIEFQMDLPTIHGIGALSIVPNLTFAELGCNPTGLCLPQLPPSFTTSLITFQIRQPGDPVSLINEPFHPPAAGSTYYLNAASNPGALHPTPEPTSWVLLGSGIAGLWFIRRRRVK